MSVRATALTIPDGARPERAEWVVFLRRLAARRTALFGLAVVAVVVALATAAPLLSPFDPIEQELGEGGVPYRSHDPTWSWPRLASRAETLESSRLALVLHPQPAGRAAATAAANRQHVNVVS